MFQYTTVTSSDFCVFTFVGVCVWLCNHVFAWILHLSESVDAVCVCIDKGLCSHVWLCICVHVCVLLPQPIPGEHWLCLWETEWHKGGGALSWLPSSAMRSIQVCVWDEFWVHICPNPHWCMCLLSHRLPPQQRLLLENRSLYRKIEKPTASRLIPSSVHPSFLPFLLPFLLLSCSFFFNCFCCVLRVVFNINNNSVPIWRAVLVRYGLFFNLVRIIPVSVPPPPSLPLYLLCNCI